MARTPVVRPGDVGSNPTRAFMKALCVITLSTWVLRNLLDANSWSQQAKLPILIRRRFGICSFQQLPVVLIRLEEEMKSWK